MKSLPAECSSFILVDRCTCALVERNCSPKSMERTVLAPRSQFHSIRSYFYELAMHQFLISKFCDEKTGQEKSRSRKTKFHPHSQSPDSFNHFELDRVLLRRAFFFRSGLGFSLGSFSCCQENPILFSLTIRSKVRQGVFEICCLPVGFFPSFS